MPSNALSATDGRESRRKVAKHSISCVPSKRALYSFERANEELFPLRGLLSLAQGVSKHTDMTARC